MDYREALEIASRAVLRLREHTVDVLTLKRPATIQTAVELSKIVSKLSPIIGNLLEYAIVEHLNKTETWPNGCLWVRQDPGFPDTVLQGMTNPQPGIEIKTWFPLATEITARFRDSQAHFSHNQTKVAMVCWLPEFIVAGQPKIIDVWIGDAIDIARARDTHYHQPPHYIVTEPEDTAHRTRNLQQSNCNGHKFQGTTVMLDEAAAFIRDWGPGSTTYSCDAAYQARLRELASRFPYRLDTNFAKMDRIGLASLEQFKSRVCSTTFSGRTIEAWGRVIRDTDERALSTLVEPTPASPVT